MNNSPLPWIAGYLSMGLLVCLPRQRRLLPWAVALGCLTLSLMKLPFYLNERQWTLDETQMMVQARMFLAGMVPWGEVDTTTSGPLNSLVLLLVAGQESYFAARWLGLGLFILSCLMGLLILGRDSSLEKSWSAGLGMIALVAFNEQLFAPDYNALYLPLALFFGGWFSLECGRKKTGAFLLGLVVLAKLQMVPVAAGLFLIEVFQPSSVRAKLTLACVFSFPLLITCGIISALGYGEDMVRSYLLMGLGYGPEVAPLGQFARLHLGDYVVWSANPLKLLAQNRDFLCFFLGCLGLGVVGKNWKRRELVILALMLFCILYPRTGVTHYLLMLVPLLPLLASSKAPEKLHRFAFLMFSLILTVKHPWQSQELRQLLMNKQNNPYEGPLLDQVRVHLKPQDRLAIWGWAPELYWATATVPATRDVIAQFQLAPGSQRAYYRDRFLSDMQKTRPQIFVDGVGGAAVFFDDREASGFETFDALRSIIAQDYELISEEPVLFGRPGRRVFRKRKE